MSTTAPVRQAEPGDLPGIAGVFLSAFPESVVHYTGRRPSEVFEEGVLIWPGGRALMTELFRICLQSEPGALLVADRQHDVAGYVFAPARASRLVPTALLRGGVARLAWGWMRGAYGIGLRPVALVAGNLARLAGGHWRERERDISCDARILSIAVDPRTNALGLGRLLLEAGLDYLARAGADRVRLEVRPGNAAAIRLYKHYGFARVGGTSDSQGPWDIMLAPLSPPVGGSRRASQAQPAE